ncbi:MAG: hypothetical protein HY645_04040 [Acidobacteria bacterium]|nr:hypothetical protein [Acidobacteriota bacterium]
MLRLFYRCRRFIAICFFSVVAGTLLLGGSDEFLEDNPCPTAQKTQAYSYRIKGKVRLLLFWLGKDDVGEGKISFATASCGNYEFEGVSVLLGSDPRRVPGGINRWGFGREWAHWRVGEDSQRVLERSVFEGFMRRSNEKSLKEVRSSASGPVSLYWYEGVRSQVFSHEAVSELHAFSEREDFDWRRFDFVHGSYHRRVQSGPPDRRKSLNNTSLYGPPFGFFTALRQAARTLSHRFKDDPENWENSRPQASWVYNAKLYRLSTRKVRYHPTFKLARREKSQGSEPFQNFSDVAEVDFRIEDVALRSKHDFSISFPLHGAMEGVPLQIVDKPRWWLHLEIYLDLPTPLSLQTAK